MSRTLIPQTFRQLIRKARLAHAARRGTLGDRGDPFFEHLADWVRPGDVVVDVGAAIGGYTLRLAELVGPEGRVFALEPIPQQFEILAANVRWAGHGNVTCLQVAASDAVRHSARMGAPIGRRGPNWYLSHLGSGGDLTVVALPLDELPLGDVAFLKIDAEGHDGAVLRGGRRTIERTRPIILAESDAGGWLSEMGYAGEGAETSANTLYRWEGEPVTH